MGNSKPPKATFDLIDSYAHLVGDDVRIVLHEPRFDIAEPAALRLIQGKRQRQAEVRVTDGATGQHVVATISRASLTDGTWNLRLRTEDRNARLNVRLLVQGDRPLVLLWGAEPLPSRLPVPHPRGGVAAVVAARGQDLARKALTKLPDERAEAVRRVVRKFQSLV